MSTSSSSNDTPSASSSSSPARATSQRWQSGRAYRTSREGIEAEVVGIRDRLGEAGGRGDHRGVVGAERDRNQLQPQPELVADRPAALGLLRAEIPYAVDQRGLQAAEAEVETAPAHGHRELEGIRIPALRRPLDRRTARVAEAEQPGTLVESLA